MARTRLPDTAWLRRIPGQYPTKMTTAQRRTMAKVVERAKLQNRFADERTVADRLKQARELALPAATRVRALARALQERCRIEREGDDVYLVPCSRGAVDREVDDAAEGPLADLLCALTVWECVAEHEPTDVMVVRELTREEQEGIPTPLLATVEAIRDVVVACRNRGARLYGDWLPGILIGPDAAGHLETLADALEEHAGLKRVAPADADRRERDRIEAQSAANHAARLGEEGRHRCRDRPGHR